MKTKLNSLLPTYAEEITAWLFKELQVVYHGSDNSNRNNSKEWILYMVKKEVGQKIWLEISYKDYSHGKFLIETEDYELAKTGTVAEFYRIRQNYWFKRNVGADKNKK